MSHRLQIFVFFTLLVISTCCANPWRASSEKYAPAFAEKIHIKGISNVGKVNEYLFRGSQPNKEAIAELHQRGITLIIDLRGEFKRRRERERGQVEALGMRFANIPGNGWSPPSDEQIAQFFHLIRERPRQRIYVHCWLGGDRSGIFLATYRMAFDHWTPKEALQEMKAFHFKGFWHPAMQSYLKKFPERLETSSVLAPYRNMRQQQSYTRDSFDMRYGSVLHLPSMAAAE